MNDTHQEILHENGMVSNYCYENSTRITKLEQGMIEQNRWNTAQNGTLTHLRSDLSVFTNDFYKEFRKLEQLIIAELISVVLFLVGFVVYNLI